MSNKDKVVYKKVTSWVAKGSARGLKAATSGWASLQHRQSARAGAGSLVALLFAIGWAKIAMIAVVATIVLPALHAARQERRSLRDQEARADACKRLHTALDHGNEMQPSESCCLRLVYQWRHAVWVQSQEVRRRQTGIWGDLCEEEATEEEMDVLERETVEAGGGLDGAWVPGFQENLDRLLQQTIMYDNNDSDY